MTTSMGSGSLVYPSVEAAARAYAEQHGPLTVRGGMVSDGQRRSRPPPLTPPARASRPNQRFKGERHGFQHWKSRL